MKREKLPSFVPLEGCCGKVYNKYDADSVMDEMEKQNRILENDKEEMYAANLVQQARIKELEAENNYNEKVKRFLLRKVKEYMNENDRLKSILTDTKESSETKGLSGLLKI